MSVNSWAVSAAFQRRRTACGRAAATLAALALAGLLPACAGTPPALVAGPDPADPSVRVAAAGYRSTIGSYTRQRPVTPAPWLEQNEQVAPSSAR